MAKKSRKLPDRRSLIKVSLILVCAVLMLSANNSFGADKSANEVARWALLADTHIRADANDNYRGFYPYRNLQKVVSEIISDLPEAVLIAGDLARLEGKQDDYVRLKSLLRPLEQKLPVFMALGNHDNRDTFSRVFTQAAGQKQAVAGKHVLVVEKPPVRVILLDSLLYVNKVPGLLGKAQRRWLQDYLAGSDNTPTILCLHHSLGDGDGDLLDVPRLFDMIEPIDKVKAILYGHSHRYKYSEYAGIHLINLPATSYTFSDAEPVGWVEARLTANGGHFILHAVAGNTEIDGKVKKLTWR
jgi:3',5'-cyclic AMP phosphodiesterase CpdA